MDFITSPLFVFLLLGAVATAAVMFEPARYSGPWRELAALYQTAQRPANINFKAEHIELGVAKLAVVDAAIDDNGFWLLATGPESRNVPDCLLVPWDCVRYRRDKQDRQHFQLRGKDPIDLLVSHELGNALQRRSQRYEVEDPLA
tara:strand:- start:40611 stop:41045 length:435 start_codon:yes stop_codon:yes gene_type:complete